MPLLSDFQGQSGAFDLAIVAATISILIGGMLFGIGLGFGIRRIRLLGSEEIGQGIISAAMVGALVAFTVLLDSTTASLVPSSLPSCPAISSPSSSPYSYYMCNLASLELSLRSLATSLSRASDISGFASSLQISTGVVSAQPFFSLESASRSLSDAASRAYSLSSLAFFELELADFVRASALSVFLPAGLLLRTFFATRRLGAAAMAIAISAYLVYPLFFLFTFTVSKSSAALLEANSAAAQFNSDFASIPLLDLDATSSVKNSIDSLSSGDFPGKLQPLFPSSFRALSIVSADLFIFPLISLIVSAVAALELYRMLSAPIFLPYFEAV